jgi:hypothetical protein
MQYENEDELFEKSRKCAPFLQSNVNDCLSRNSSNCKSKEIEGTQIPPTSEFDQIDQIPKLIRKTPFQNSGTLQT